MFGGRWFDPVALAVVFAALIAWIFGLGWWTPVVGSLLVGFGPGYLLLRGAARTVPSLVVRAGLYVGTSVAISVLVGLAIATTGTPLSYVSVASSYLLIVVLLFLVQELAIKRGNHKERNERRQPHLQRSALLKGSLLVALPFVGSLVLLATAPVRSPVSTELYLAPPGSQIRNLPTTYGPGKPLEFRVIGHLGTPATDGVLNILADDQLVASWRLTPGSTSVDRLVSIDTSQIESKALRIEARLSSPGQRDHAVWLTLTEEAAK